MRLGYSDKTKKRILDQFLEFRDIMTRKQMAAHIDVSLTTIARWLDGEGFPNTKSIRKIKLFLLKKNGSC